MIPKAKDIMVTEILAADLDWSVHQLAEFFDEHAISGAPVTNGTGEIIGVVSVTDIVRQSSQPLRETHTEKQTHDYYLRSLQDRLAGEELGAYQVDFESEVEVRDIMTPLVFDVDEQTSVSDIANTMITGHIHRVFVTRNKRVVGIITALDMLKVVRDWPLNKVA